MNENQNNFNEAEVRKAPVNKRTLITVLIAAAAVIALGVTGASVFFASPLTRVEKGLINSAKALEKNEIVALLEKCAEGGSVQIEIGLEGILESVLGLSVDSMATFKLYSDGEDGAALTADVTVRDELFLDASVVASKTDVTVTSQKLLGGEVYGVDLEHAAENFEGSVFGPNGPFSLGIASLEELTGNTAESEQMNEDAQEIAESFFAVLLDSLKQNAVIGKENTELDLGGEKVKMTAVGIELDSEAAANVFADLVEYLYTDEDLEAFLRTYETAIVEYLSSLDAIEDSESFVDDFYDSLEEIYTQPDDYKQRIVESGVELSVMFYVTKSGKELVGFDFAVELDGEEASVSVLAGPALSDLREVKIEVGDGWSVVLVEYTVEVNDKTDYAARYAVYEDDTELMSGNVVWDKTSGAYALTIPNDYDETLGLEGKFELSAQSATLTVEKITSGVGYVEMELDLSIQINASDKMPDMPENYTDVLTMSQYELEDLTADMAAALMNEVYSLDQDVLSALQYLMWYFM